MTALDDSAYSARILDERTPGDRHEIKRLRSVAGVVERDLYAVQLAELAGLRGVGDMELSEPPRWVYYPWRTALARVLGPTGYRRLRLDRNRNKITEVEQRFHAGLTIGVVGASVGHLVVLGLALEGLFATARIADFDTVELSNLNRLPGSVLDYGLSKTVVLARRVAEIDPYLVVEANANGVDVAGAAAFVQGLDLVIEVCDSLDVKLAVREQARRLGVPVIMVTSDRGTVDIERFDLEPSRRPFHGLVDGVTSTDLTGLSSADKVPYVMKIVGADGLSPRMAASMIEIDESLTTWPHLAGDALQAAACAVIAVRRFGYRSGPPSGRRHIDIAGQLDLLTDPVAPTDLPPFTPLGDYRNLPEPESDLDAIVRAGQLAPSGGNCQPWRFVVRGDSIEVELDRRQTTAMDVEFRASYLAIGAAVLNMRIAAAQRGVLGTVDCFPGGPNVAPVAVFTLGSGRDEQLARSHRHMLRRVTNRNLGDSSRTITNTELATLVSAARTYGADLAAVTAAPQLSEAATILTDTDHIRYLIPALHSEMMGELRDPRTDDVNRGIDVRTLELGSATPLIGIARRSDVMAELADRDQGRNLGKRVGDLVEASAALVAVTISGARPLDYLHAGQAMQAVWIAATAVGLTSQPIVPLFLFSQNDTELNTLAGRYSHRLTTARRRLRELLNISSDQTLAMILRLAHAPAPSAISLRDAQTAQSK